MFKNNPYWAKDIKDRIALGKMLGLDETKIRTCC